MTSGAKFALRRAGLDDIDRVLDTVAACRDRGLLSLAPIDLVHVRSVGLWALAQGSSYMVESDGTLVGVAIPLIMKESWLTQPHIEIVHLWVDPKQPAAARIENALLDKIAADAAKQGLQWRTSRNGETWAGDTLLGLTVVADPAKDSHAAPVEPTSSRSERDAATTPTDDSAARITPGRASDPAADDGGTHRKRKRGTAHTEHRSKRPRTKSREHFESGVLVGD